MPENESEAGGSLLVPHMLFGTFRRESSGYRTVCRSPGVSETMARGAQRHCEGWGSCVEAGFTRAVVHQVLPVTERSGDERLYFLAIRVTNLGTDHKGRPGALCFHVAFFDEDGYARVGFEPFLLDRAGAFLGDWDGHDSFPPLYVEPSGLPAPAAGDLDPGLLRLLRDHLVHVLAGHTLRYSGRLPTPASDDRVALLFRLLPWAARRRMAAATFTFSARRDYALAVEHGEHGRIDLTRPQPLPSLPRDLPPAVAAYADEAIEALHLHDLRRLQALARSANPYAVQAPPAGPQEPRSVLGRLLGFERRTNS